MGDLAEMRAVRGLVDDTWTSSVISQSHEASHLTRWYMNGIPRIARRNGLSIDSVEVACVNHQLSHQDITLPLNTGIFGIPTDAD